MSASSEKSQNIMVDEIFCLVIIQNLAFLLSSASIGEYKKLSVVRISLLWVHSPTKRNRETKKPRIIFSNVFATDC